jgi:uncharacterized membrane protein required for colicin V production
MTNLFDLTIMALFGGTVLLSFLGGLGRVFSTLAGLYGGALLAAWFYEPVTDLVLARLFPQMNTFTGNLTAFLLLLFISSLSISIALGRNFFLKQITRRIGIFNNLTGGVLGIVIAIFAAVLATMITSLLLQLLNSTAALASSPTMSLVRYELTRSTLVPLFLRLVPVVVLPLRPFLPQGLPPLLMSGH